MRDYEQLGVFYLGRAFDPAAGKTVDEPVLYDAKDLTTHAVILGMTGSGKTGLAIDLIEEAAIDGVPTIAIDPKGDLGNLLLTFPALRGEDFRPWIDEADARRRGVEPDVAAQETADRWRKGLSDWGQGPDRIARYRDAVDAVIYTPGSTSGRPLAVWKSFAAPGAAVTTDPEALRARVTSTASGLLALVGIDADPLRSREHVLVANLLETAWRAGRDLDLGSLIRDVQTPPFERLGVLDLESFYPAKERFALAMALNGLVASPGFAAWTEGEPLDVARLLWTPAGKPRLSVVSIAHLSDAERMFFVTALLNEVIAWMRAQPGTSSLRALLYMDEVFGYFPPTANPPSKLPLLMLMKQARAFGLGVVLATQNPVDLDYKGLGNAGTWFLGRLQTERDKARVVDGLEGASAAAASFDRARLDATLSALKPRTFLMVNAHDDAPTLFQTRWALSYLAGPLTRPQIQALTTARAAAAAPSAPAAPVGLPAARPAATAERGAGTRPMLAPDVPEYFWPTPDVDGGWTLEYRPALYGTARLHYVDAKAGVDAWESLGVRAALPDELSTDPWEGATVLDGRLPTLGKQPAAGARFAALAGPATRGKSYVGWQRALEEWIYRSRSITVWRSPAAKATSRPGESEADFRARLALFSRERRDEAIEDLRRRYASRVTTLTDRIRAGRERVAREKSQATAAKVSTGVSVFTSVLAAIFGRKVASVGTASRVGTTIRGVGRSQKEAADVARAEESAEVLEQRLAALNAEIEAEVRKIQDAPDAAADVTSARIAPRKSDVSVSAVALAWVPHRVHPDGRAEPLA